MSAQVGTIKTFATAPSGDSAPDSVTKVGNSTFIEYGNNADSTGQGGSSSIVQYGPAGQVLHTYTLAGSVDGLKYNAGNGLLYALQNQDGNSTLTLIDPHTHHVSAPLAYGTTSATRGRDDVAFTDGHTFLSYTNPDATASHQGVIQEVLGVSNAGKIATASILDYGAKGTDTVTGKHQVIPLSDPDSLKTAPNGDLILSSGADGVIVDVKHPGESSQSVKFTQVTDRNGVAASGLDDVIKPAATSGTFTLTNTSGNDVLTFHVSHLNPHDYYASVSSLGGFGQIDPKTGVFKLLVPAAGAHGLAFQPSPGSEQDHFVYSDAGVPFGSSASARSGSSSFSSSALAQAIHDGGISAGTTSLSTPTSDAGANSLSPPDLKAHTHQFHIG